MRTIQAALKEHYQAVIEYGINPNNILGVFLYGSQNYGVDLPTSDVDTKAVFIPTFEQLVLDKKMVNHEIHLENGEHCEVMDVRHIVNEFRKQNINFVEVLFTDHFIVNPQFEDLWNDYYISNRDRICRYDITRGVNSIIGQAKHTINQNKTNGKKIANGLRLLYFLEHLLAGAPYEDCIVPVEEVREKIKELKSIETLESEDDANFLLQEFDAMKADFEAGEFVYIPENKNALDVILNDGILEIVKRGLENDSVFNR